MTITLGTFLMLVAFACFLVTLVRDGFSLSNLAFTCWTGAILFGGLLEL